MLLHELLGELNELMHAEYLRKDVIGHSTNIHDLFFFGKVFPPCEVPVDLSVSYFIWIQLHFPLKAMIKIIIIFKHEDSKHFLDIYYVSGSEISVLPVLSHRIVTVTLWLGTLFSTFWELNQGEAGELRFESWQADPRARSLRRCGLRDFCGWKKKTALLAVSETKSYFVSEEKK